MSVMNSSAMRAANRRRSMRNTGFSLIEVLITLVVLSVGLLGLGLMQATGLRFTKSSYWRTQAVLLSNDIADRVRANAGNAIAYNATVTPTATSAPACIAGASCTSLQVAASDLKDWSNRIFTEFSSGSTGTVVVSTLDTPSTLTSHCPLQPATTVQVNSMRVILQWNEINSATANQNLAGGEANDCFQTDFTF